MYVCSRGGTLTAATCTQYHIVRDQRGGRVCLRINTHFVARNPAARNTTRGTLMEATGQHSTTEQHAGAHITTKASHRAERPPAFFMRVRCMTLTESVAKMDRIPSLSAGILSSRKNGIGSAKNEKAEASWQRVRHGMCSGESRPPDRNIPMHPPRHSRDVALYPLPPLDVLHLEMDPQQPDR